MDSPSYDRMTSSTQHGFTFVWFFVVCYKKSKISVCFLFLFCFKGVRRHVRTFTMFSLSSIHQDLFEVDRYLNSIRKS